MSEVQESRYIDKSEWGPGPWQDEPDRIEWRSQGFPCLIVRGGGGALCGYVGVPEGHPFFQANGFSGEPDCLEVHGGITYGDFCQEDGKICHVARPGEPDRVWWLGFDCGHRFDIRPQDSLTYRRYGYSHGNYPGATYKPVYYVRAEVERLAEQLRAVDP